MKRFLAMLTAIAFLGLAGVAQADEATGRVQATDPASGTLMLEDGTVFTVDEGIPIDNLQPGTEVTVSYEDLGGEKRATNITPAE